MPEISAREKREAQDWMVKMLDDPVAYREGFNGWAAGAPGRLEYYERLLGSVQIAGRAARQIRDSERPQSRPSFARRWLPIVGLVTATLVLGLFLGRSIPPSWDRRPEMETADLSTAIGEVRRETLGDGSRIVLDTDTQMSADLKGDQRRIELKRGRARFTVAHDASHPFIVTAGSYEIKATGTVFDVNLQGGFKVQLLEGAVLIGKRGDFARPNARPLFELRPGQQLSISDGQAGKAEPVSARGSDAQWVNGVRTFDAAPIRQVISEANRYSVTQIRLADTAIGDREIFGEINIRDTGAVAQTIADYLQLRVDRSQSGMLVLTAEK
jgi:transmembrane sensor